MRKWLESLEHGLRNLGWVVGFEPTTAGATVRSSTTELHPPQLSKNYNIQSSERIPVALIGCCLKPAFNEGSDTTRSRNEWADSQFALSGYGCNL
jgi:hypothetical protein